MDFRIMHSDRVDSTNRMLSSLYQEGKAHEGLVITAGEQLFGMGQEKNVWHSEPDQNLLMSIFLKPDFLSAAAQFSLNKVIALSTMETVFHFLPGKNIRIKWPNDIYAGDLKIAGILIRHFIAGSSIDGSIAGIGINVRQKTFPEWIPNPCSVFSVSGELIPIDELLIVLLDRINHHYENLLEGRMEYIEKSYLSNLYRYGVWHEYLINGERTTAMITKTDEYGRLILNDPNGKAYCCGFKEIVYCF